MTGSKRFGGAYSPGGPRTPGGAGQGPRPAGSTRWTGRAAHSVSMRALLLFLLPTPLLVGALGTLAGGRGGATVVLLAAYALLMAGAHMTREGLKAAQAWEASALARAPALPRKLIGAALTGAGVFLAAWRGGGVVEPMILGGLAAALHVAAFGPDPMRAKGLAGLEGVALEEAVTKLETARGLIAEMRAAAEGFGDRALSDRVAGLARQSEAVLAELERDPGDIRRARRFLAVYLVGARDATVRFAQSWGETRDPEIAARYADLLGDLEAHFARHREELSSNDRAALDVEIEVLRDRLRMEGV